MNFFQILNKKCLGVSLMVWLILLFASSCVESYKEMILPKNNITLSSSSDFTKTQTQSIPVEYRLLNDADPLLNDDIWDYLRDENDQENNNVNWVLMNFVEAINAACANEDYRRVIIDKLWNSDRNIVPILELMEENDALAIFIDNHIREGLIRRISDNPISSIDLIIINNSDLSLANIISNEMIYKDITYEPWMYFVGDLDEAFKSYDRPSIFVGEEITEEDEIIGYSNDNLKIVSEEEAIDYSEPLIIIGTGYIEYGIEEFEKHESEFKETYNTKDLKNWNFYMREYQIKDGHRYDRNNKSELGGGIGNYHQTYTVNRDFEYYQYEDFRWDRIKIHKDDIAQSKIFEGEWHGSNLWYEIDEYRRQQTQAVLTSGRVPGMTAILYEYDWYANKLWYPNNEHVDHIPIEFKSKYSHEWYWRYSGFLDDFIPGERSKNFHNSKAYFELERR